MISFLINVVCETNPVINAIYPLPIKFLILYLKFVFDIV